VTERLRPLEERVAEEDAIPDDIVAEMRAPRPLRPVDPRGVWRPRPDMTEECASPSSWAHLAGLPLALRHQHRHRLAGHRHRRHGGAEAQLPAELAAGEIDRLVRLTEPDAGSDAASLRTSARRDGDHYILNGTKRFITNAPEAGVFTVMARSNPAEKGAGGISAFLVEAGTPGLKLGKTDRKMGQRGNHTCDVIFENCRVPARQLIGGKEGQGFKTAMKVLDRGRLSIAAVCVGVAERLIRDSLAYAMERKQFGRPIADFQLVQAMLADSQTEAYAARSMVLDAARRRDDGELVSTEAACCKLFASEMVRPRRRPRGADPRRRRLHRRLRRRALLPRRAPVPHL
jgi:acyl-CoA dehydrogenase